MKKCSIEGCENTYRNVGFCNMHYLRYRKYGDPLIKKNNFGSGVRIKDGYIEIYIGDDRYKFEHTLVAEKALGKPLPKGAVVHHVNGVKHDNRPENLVICPSVAYHIQLHARQRQLGITFHEDN